MKKIFVCVSCLVVLTINLGIHVLKDEKKRRNAQMKYLIDDAEKKDRAKKRFDGLT